MKKTYPAVALSLTAFLFSMEVSAQEVPDQIWQNHKECKKVNDKGCTGNSGKMCYTAPEKHYIKVSSIIKGHKTDGKNGQCYEEIFENYVTKTLVHEGVTYTISEPRTMCSIAHIESGSGPFGINDTHSVHCNYKFTLQKYLP